MSQAKQSQQEPSLPGGISVGVVWLGIVSFLTDVSSETIFAILPIYFIGVLSGSALVLGIMEGLADFASSSLDLAAGYASDRTGKRKWIAFSGYAVSTTAKSLLVLATSVAGLVAFRVMERLGKSIRGAPRDAVSVDGAKAKARNLLRHSQSDGQSGSGNRPLLGLSSAGPFWHDTDDVLLVICRGLGSRHPCGDRARPLRERSRRRSEAATHDSRYATVAGAPLSALSSGDRGFFAGLL
jgi:hypothetical protein